MSEKSPFPAWTSPDDMRSGRTRFSQSSERWRYDALKNCYQDRPIRRFIRGTSPSLHGVLRRPNGVTCRGTKPRIALRRRIRRWSTRPRRSMAVAIQVWSALRLCGRENRGAGPVRLASMSFDCARFACNRVSAFDPAYYSPSGQKLGCGRARIRAWSFMHSPVTSIHRSERALRLGNYSTGWRTRTLWV